MPRQVIHINDATDLLGVSLSTIYRLYHKGALEGFEVGRRKMLYLDSIQKYQEGHSNQVKAEKTEKAVEPKNLRSSPAPSRATEIRPFVHLH